MAQMYTPSQEELENSPHIVLRSPHEWEPMKARFQKTSHSLEEEMTRDRDMRGISGIYWGDRMDEFVSNIDNEECGREIKSHEFHENDIIMDIGGLDTRMISSFKTNDISDIELGNDIPKLEKIIDIGKYDVPQLKIFESKSCHNNVTPGDLSERWIISIKQATETLKKTTQRFICSSVLPLDRRYPLDRIF